MKPFLHKVYRLMSEEGISYQEACRRIGRRGGLSRARRKKQADELWHRIRQASRIEIESDEEGELVTAFPNSTDKAEQTYFDFN